MELNGILIPRRLWIDLLSYLDGKSLRNSLLVSKKWFEYGSNEKLNAITKRNCLQKNLYYHN